MPKIAIRGFVAVAAVLASLSGGGAGAAELKVVMPQRYKRRYRNSRPRLRKNRATS